MKKQCLCHVFPEITELFPHKLLLFYILTESLNDNFCTTQVIFNNLNVRKEEMPETAEGRPIDLSEQQLMWAVELHKFTHPVYMKYSIM